MTLDRRPRLVKARWRSEVLASFPRERRNPLRVFRLGSPDAVTVRMHDMLRQVGHLVRLADDLMELSRVTGGARDVRKTVDLAALVRSTVETTPALFEAGRRELIIIIPAEPIPVHADPVRLEQVTGDLLNDAADYSEQHGGVTLTIRPEKSEALVSIRDDAIGLPAEMLPRVFQGGDGPDTRSEFVVRLPLAGGSSSA